MKTRLILFEGPPGSGKSTTARRIADEISRQGNACQCFLEWSTDHPIPIGDDQHLGEALRSSIAREGERLELWRQFVQSRQTDDVITVMESRFWQTSVMLMYAAGHPVGGVLESNRRVVDAIRPLKPVLVYFEIDPLQEFVQRTIQIKEREWQQANLPGTWAGHVFAAFDGLVWFHQRGLSGQEGLVAFLEDWATIAEQLYAELPFPKLKIRNPHTNWPAAMRQIGQFLALSEPNDHVQKAIFATD
jgi:thymidylate kinase